MAKIPKQVAEMVSAVGPKVKQAYGLARHVHEGQKRKTGEDYIVHPVDVASMLFSMGADEDVLSAALLHDALEDTEDPQEMRNQIYREFGGQVLYLVDAVSKDMAITDKKEQQEAYIQQIQQAFDLDIFVFFIKVADLLDNMRTITALSPERTERWIHELKYQYWPIFSEYFHKIPLAHREMYQQLLDKVQATIDQYEAGVTASKVGRIDHSA